MTPLAALLPDPFPDDWSWWVRVAVVVVVGGHLVMAWLVAGAFAGATEGDDLGLGDSDDRDYSGW